MILYAGLNSLYVADPDLGNERFNVGLTIAVQIFHAPPTVSVSLPQTAPVACHQPTAPPHPTTTPEKTDFSSKTFGSLESPSL